MKDSKPLAYSHNLKRNKDKYSSCSNKGIKKRLLDKYKVKKEFLSTNILDQLQAQENAS